jgi:hypothetical protein
LESALSSVTDIRISRSLHAGVNIVRESAGRFTSLRAVASSKSSVSAGQTHFWRGFDSRQVHREEEGQGEGLRLLFRSAPFRGQRPTSKLWCTDSEQVISQSASSATNASFVRSDEAAGESSERGHATTPSARDRCRRQSGEDAEQEDTAAASPVPERDIRCDEAAECGSDRDRDEQAQL